MDTTFLLWSAASRERRDVVSGTGVHLPHPASTLPPEQLPPSPPTAPSSQPSSKKKRKPAARPKRPPQRGLGVEKLERLRLQERWQKMTEIEPPQPAEPQIHTPAAIHGHQQLLVHYAVSSGQCHQAPHSPFGLYNSGNDSIHLGYPVDDRMSLRARFVAAPAPAGCGAACGESCFFQRHRALGPISGVGSAAAFPDGHGAADRVRIAAAEAAGFFQVGGGNYSAELPSSQSLQCSPECEICIRKRLLEAKLRPSTGAITGSGNGKRPRCLFGAADRMPVVSSYLAGQEVLDERGGVKEMKYYEFFPCRGGGDDGRGSNTGSTTLGDRPNTLDESLPSSASERGSSGKKLDLSLRLSCWY